MKQWYFDLAKFKPEIGFKFQFHGGPKDGIQYVHLCEITEVIKEKKLKYSWKYEGYAGNLFFTFKLFSERKQTRMKPKTQGLERFNG